LRDSGAVYKCTDYYYYYYYLTMDSVLHLVVYKMWCGWRRTIDSSGSNG